MKTVLIRKAGRKWIVVDKQNNELFKGNTRKACFYFIHEMNKHDTECNLKLEAYQHGGQ